MIKINSNIIVHFEWNINCFASDSYFDVDIKLLWKVAKVYKAENNIWVLSYSSPLEGNAALPVKIWHLFLSTSLI